MYLVKVLKFLIVIDVFIWYVVQVLIIAALFFVYNLQTTTPLSMNPLENAGNLDFFGQRPWRQGFQGNRKYCTALASQVTEL